MRFIVNKKIYDTEKAELICEAQREWIESTILGDMRFKKHSKLYKTQKGQFFFVAKTDYGNQIKLIKLVNENATKSFIMRTDCEKYVDLYGELEEG